MIKSFSSFNSSARELREQGEVTSLPHCKAVRAMQRNCVLCISFFSISFLSLLYLQHSHTELDCLEENHYGKVTEEEKQEFKKLTVCYLIIRVSDGRCEMGIISS